MNNKFYNYLLLILAFSYLSCDEFTYSPSGENFESIELPDTRMEINLQDIGDTAVVWGTTKINYNFNTYGKEFNSVELYLDSLLVARSSNLNYLIFNSKNYPDGNHQIVLLLTAKSGSGSLADQLNLEYVVLVKEFVMTIQNNTPPKPLSISKIETSSGFAKLTWPKYKFSNFESYRIYAEIYVPPYDYSNEYLKTTIENRDSTTWIDDQYVGGKIKYTIDVVTSDGIIYGDPFEFEAGTAKINTWEVLDVNNVKIVWNRCKTDSTFSSYELYKKAYPWDMVASITDINDTLITTAVGFGKKIDFFVKTVSKRNIDFFLNSFSPIESIFIGNPIPAFNQLEYIQATNSIYLTRSDSTFRLDASTNQLLAKEKYMSDVSFDGTRGYALKDLSQIVEIDPISLNEIRTINLQDLLIATNRINKIFTGKSNIIYCNTYNQGILMIDVDAHQIVTKRQLFDRNPTIYQSSPHGYLIHERTGGGSNGNVFRVDLSIDSIVNSGLYVQDYKCIGLSYTGNLDMIIDSYASRIWTATHNGIDYVTFKEFNVPQEILYPTRDPKSGLIGGFEHSFGYFVIYDVNTQSEYKRIKLSSGFSGNIYLFDSKVYSTNGVYMELN
ncbi:MAG: hypothetical protein IPH97_04480 [Ignavibacteriales bacterium]|nr:hypothetical protein [Ignavibacteriales bacterium]